VKKRERGSTRKSAIENVNEIGGKKRKKLIGREFRKLVNESESGMTNGTGMRKLSERKKKGKTIRGNEKFVGTNVKR
jgi:hypothetical protein